MAFVGSVEFITLKGGPAEQAEEVETITRSNIDGVRLRKTGKKPTVRVFRGKRDDTSAANAASSRRTLLAMQGTLQSITDDTGEVETNVGILRVNPGTPRRIESAIGGVQLGAGLYLTEFVLQTVSTELT